MNILKKDIEKIKNADFCIIGASIAGCVLAKGLAKKGKVLLLDKTIPGTYGNCAGGMPRVLFDKLQIEIPFIPINRATFSFKSHKINFKCDYVVFDRKEFDSAIFTHTINSEVKFLKANFLNFSKEKSEFQIFYKQKKLTIAYKKLILTYGLKRNNRENIDYALSNMEVVKSRTPYPNTIFFDMSASGFKFGYSWIFPMPDNNINIGTGCLGKNEFSKKHLEAFKEKHKLTGKVIYKGGAGIPLFPRFKVQEKNVFYFGDSAGMVSAQNGEGLKHIIKYKNLWINAISNNKELNYSPTRLFLFLKLFLASQVIKTMKITEKYFPISIYKNTSFLFLYLKSIIQKK